MQNNDIRAKKERLFKILVWILIFVLFALTVFILHRSYKNKTKLARQVYAEVQQLRFEGSVFPAAEKLSTLSDQDFWRLWPVLSRNIMMYEAPFYYGFAERFWRDNDKKQAAFWMMLGRYRLNYDSARCDHEKAVYWRDYFDKKLSSKDIFDYLDQNNIVFKSVLNDILAWNISDVTQSDPSYLCAFIYQPFSRYIPLAPRQEWGEIHRQIRLSTLDFLKKE